MKNFKECSIILDDIHCHLKSTCQTGFNAQLTIWGVKKHITLQKALWKHLSLASWWSLKLIVNQCGPLWQGSAACYHSNSRPLREQLPPLIFNTYNALDWKPPTIMSEVPDMPILLTTTLLQIVPNSKLTPLQYAVDMLWSISYVNV